MHYPYGLYNFSIEKTLSPKDIVVRFLRIRRLRGTCNEAALASAALISSGWQIKLKPG
jgi:hypothetical protein